MTTSDHLAQIGQTGHAFSPSPDGTWFRSGTEARQDCDETRPAVLRQVVKLLIRPAPPTGPGPATTSGQVTPRHKASHSGGHTRGHQPTAQHHQAAKAILTVIPPRQGAPRFRRIPDAAISRGSDVLVAPWAPRLVRVGEPDLLRVLRADHSLAFGARLVQLGGEDCRVAADDDRTSAPFDDDYLRAWRVARRRDHSKSREQLELPVAGYVLHVGRIDPLAD